LKFHSFVVVMFPSEMASAPWKGTGSVYNPPKRNWHFDLNFTNRAKLLPIGPAVRVIIRGKWAIVAPN
jgi:hypothetical protein